MAFFQHDCREIVDGSSGYNLVPSAVLLENGQRLWCDFLKKHSLWIFSENWKQTFKANSDLVSKSLIKTIKIAAFIQWFSSYYYIFQYFIHHHVFAAFLRQNSCYKLLYDFILHSPPCPPFMHNLWVFLINQTGFQYIYRSMKFAIYLILFDNFTDFFGPLLNTRLVQAVDVPAEYSYPVRFWICVFPVT